ncbi:ferric reductase-like protein transmembrane component 4 [Phaeosphaeriaceae sp. PMI808]|nr:ferric reductase-like protein transmembrane component 4 [Phaeosphaeriaceae sp. PMI808]
MEKAATRRNYGLVGYGFQIFQPPCAFACRDAIAGAKLKCSTVDGMSAMEGMDMGGMVMTDPQCYATDDVFLQTMAWCISSRCKSISTWKLERYWKENIPGALAVQPDPKETFQEALAKVIDTPTVVYAEPGSLNVTSNIAEDLWFAAYNTDIIFAHQESMQEGYALILFLSGVIIPICFSLLRFVPFHSTLRSKFHAYVIDAPLFGNQHAKFAQLGLEAAITRGQALFISYLVIINVVLSAVNYRYANPNTFYPGDRWGWMIMLVSNRLGLLSFANLPLVFLYASRNNLLLWLTNWSHSTFLLLHRWVASIATLQAILHSIIYLHKYIKVGTHATTSKLPYWYWGIVATLGMTVLFPTSIGIVRRKSYELFLVWHVMISILVVVGCYWHIVFEFQHSWGYELWIIVTMAIWGFDRLARWLRIAKNGIKMAEVTAIDEDYIRVTVPGVAISGYAYLYFPTLTWRVWENHPFSVSSTVLSASGSPQERIGFRASHDLEKHIEISATSAHSRAGSESGPGHAFKQPLQAGITFYIRGKTGITFTLRHRTSLPVLLEGGYSSHSTSALNKSPTLIAIVGGVGITAVLPCLRTHPGRVKLYWGCRSQPLIDDVKSSGALSLVEQEILANARMSVADVLASELTDTGGNEIAVLVSGPENMANEVRNSLRYLVGSGKGVNAKLYIESFSW